VLVLAALVLLILAALGVGMLTTAYGVRHRAILLKNEAAAMLAAEAGYEQAIFWMTQQKDVLSALQKQIEGTSGTLSFADSSCNYEISLFKFIGKAHKGRPVFQVKSVGHSGVFSRTVDVYVIQAIPGWAMGMCRVASGGTSSYPVNFADGEIIDMPIHINKLSSSIDPTDLRDIYISGEPSFLERVAMGESKYRAGGGDKPGDGDSRDYDDLISLGLFNDGILFDQPDCRITDEEAVDMKLERFEASTKEQFKFEPEGTALLATTSYTTNLSATQLEFFVDNGIGKVRITNNCTVLGYKRTNGNTTWDYKVTPGTSATQFETYHIYAYHVRGEAPQTFKLEQTYVTQSYGGVESEPGGQIYVDGNIVIGGHNAAHNGDQVIKGTIAVVATDNIWIADNLQVSDYDSLGNYWPRGADGMPDVEHNPNAIGLIAKGVVKVIDPGMSEYESGYSEFDHDGSSYTDGGDNYYPGRVPDEYISGSLGYIYCPVAHPEPSGETYERYLSDPTVVEAAVTVGGGGWGAENVARYYYYKYYGGRQQDPTTTPSWPTKKQDNLILRGAITESMRGVVGLIGLDGYLKQYYLDDRLLEGILPGDIWLQGKYVPTPAGWHDYRQ